MASALLSLGTLCFGFSSNRSSIPISSNPFSISKTLAFSSASETHWFKLKHLLRVSPEGIPSELVEESKFVPLNEDEPRYGPPALLLLGFEIEETAKIQHLLKELDGEFLKVIHCTEDMISCSLWDAMHTEQPNLEAVKAARSLPRICFLSGLNGEEMMMFIDAFPETGLKPVVFAALVPNSADKTLQELIEEIMGDHEMMSAKQSSTT